MLYEVLLSWLLAVTAFYSFVHYLAFVYPQPAVEELALPKAFMSDRPWVVARNVGFVVVLMTCILVILMLLARAFPWAFRVVDYLVVFTCSFSFARLFQKEDDRLRRVIALAAAVIFLLAWSHYRNWLVHDSGFVIAAAFILMGARNIPLRVCAMVSSGVLIYDAIAVFGTGHMTDFAQRIGFDSVFLAQVPVGIALSSKLAFGLGLGDILVPGWTILVAGRRHGWTGAIFAIAGNLLGHVATLLALHQFHAAQPATIYLVPFTFLGFGAAVLARRGVPVVEEANG